MTQRDDGGPLDVSERRLRSMLDAMLDPQMFVLPRRDAAGRITDFEYAEVNRATCEDKGLAREQLIGTTFAGRNAGPAARRLLEMYVHAYEAGEPLALDSFPFPGGSGERDTRYYDVRCSPAGDGLSLTYRDVTDRVVASRTIAEREEHYRLLAQHTTDVVLQVGLDGTILWASPSSETTMGWAPDELVGRTNLEMVHPDDRLWFRAETIRLASTGEPSVLTVRVMGRDGSSRWMEAAGSHVPARDDRPAFRVVRLRDVHRQVLTTRALAESEKRFRLMADNSSDVIVHYRDGSVRWVSRSVERALGGTPDDWTGLDPLDLVHPDDTERLRAVVARVLAGEVVLERLRARSLDGVYHWLEVHASAHRTGEETPDGILASLRVVDDEVAALDELDRLARLDPLTGVANRAEAFRRIKARLADDRAPGVVAVMFCDLDRFKDVNDTYGHAAGDQMLRTVVGRISECTRVGDTVARIGGDELLVVLDGIRDLDEAVAVAEKVRHAVLEPIPHDQHELEASLSIGVTLRRASDDLDALIARADQAMYAAKQAGRNRVVALP